MIKTVFPLLIAILYCPLLYGQCSNSISGNVFLDLNSDNIPNNNDKGQAAVRLYLYEDVNGNGSYQAAVDQLLETTLSDANGDYSFSIGSTSISTSVSNSNDDAEERISTGSISRGSSDLELIADGGNNQLVGVRFRDLNIPQGAVITSAYITFTTDETNNSTPSGFALSIDVEDIDHSAVFSNTNFDISSRTLSGSPATWSNINTWNTVGETHDTPDLSTLVQSIVDRGGWATGNAMSFIISGTSGGRRVAESFDGSAAPTLHVTYSSGSTGSNYLVAIETGDLGSSATLSADEVIAVSNAEMQACKTDAYFGYYGETTACYAIADGGNTLYVKNRFSGEDYEVGGNGVSDIEAMAINVFLDIVYATNGGDLGYVDRVTGAFTTIGSLGTADGADGSISLTDVDGLTVNPFTGVMYGSHRRSDYDIIFQIDPTTGTVIPDAFGSGIDYVEITGAGIGRDIDDFMINPYSGRMYAANSNGGSYSSQLIEINYRQPNAGEAVVIGSFDGGTGSTNMDIEGIGSSDCGQIYVTSGNSGGGADNSLFSVDETTGATTLVATFSGGSDYEAADCLFAPLNSVKGVVFNDLNGNTVEDAGEGGIAGVTLHLYSDENQDGVVDANDLLLQTVTSDANGEYAFKIAGVIGDFIAQIDETTLPVDFSMTTLNSLERSYPACTIGTDFVTNFGAADPNALPLSWVSITATAASQSVILTWKVIEVDNAFFTVEKSIDGERFFEVAVVTAEENKSLKGHTYTYEDVLMLQKAAYYRVRQTNTDGSASLSDVVHVTVNDNNAEIQLSGNPTTQEEAKMYFYNMTGEKSIALYNSHGGMLYNTTSSKIETLELAHLAELQAGVYVVVVHHAGSTYQKQLILR